MDFMLLLHIKMQVNTALRSNEPLAIALLLHIKMQGNTA